MFPLLRSYFSGSPSSSSSSSSSPSSSSSSSSQSCHFSKVPTPVKCLIFDMLAFRDNCRCASVSPEFNRLGNKKPLDDAMSAFITKTSGEGTGLLKGINGYDFLSSLPRCKRLNIQDSPEDSDTPNIPNEEFERIHGIASKTSIVFIQSLCIKRNSDTNEDEWDNPALLLFIRNTFETAIGWGDGSIGRWGKNSNCFLLSSRSFSYGVESHPSGLVGFFKDKSSENQFVRRVNYVRHLMLGMACGRIDNHFESPVQVVSHKSMFRCGRQTQKVTEKAITLEKSFNMSRFMQGEEKSRKKT